MTEFSANQFAIGDIGGMSLWEIGHYRQHVDYNNVLAARTPPIILPLFPIIDFISADRDQFRFWLDAHEKWHEQVRPYANVSGADLSLVDFNNPTSFYEWIDTHNQEHALLDQAFGLT